MNVLHVIASMEPERGGVCQALRNSIPALSEIGCYSEVLSFDSPDATYLGKDRFLVHPIGPAKGPYAYCKNLSTWLMKNHMRFDAIIIHGLWLHNSYGTYQVIKKLRKANKSDNRSPKLFLMPHGMLDPYFQKANGRKLKALRNWLFWKFIENKVANGVDGLLFTCEEERLLARQPFKPYYPNREMVVGLGIEPPPMFEPGMGTAFQEKNPALHKEKNYILFLSRIHVKKGIDLLIKAYIRLWTEGVICPPLVVAGPGWETPYGRDLSQMASKCPAIICVDMLSGDAKWGAFYGCEAFVLPSHQENFGIAIVEAMACGKPVLISNKVNIWREIESGGGGLIETDTEEGIYRMLKQWIHFKLGEKESAATAANHVYRNQFSREKAAKRMVDALKSV